MAFFGKLFRSKPARVDDPISGELHREEADPANWDERWWLLFKKLEVIFEGRGFADESEDLAMQVIVILIARGHGVGDPNTFFSALNIAKKLSLEEWRKTKRRQLHDEFDEAVASSDTMATPQTKLEGEEYERIRGRCFEQAINELSAKDRWLLMAYKNCINAGLTVEQCAERIGMNNQTLKNKASILLMRVRTYARRCMKNAGY